jgi:16S rRNA (uracil1498-N3)-methyltransferase
VDHSFRNEKGMKRFYLKQKFFEGGTYQLPKDESNHAKNVLRLDPGTKIKLLNGEGQEALATIEKIDSEECQVRVEEVMEIIPNAPLYLLQSTLKGPKMDWLLEKATELGVHSIQLLQTERTIAKTEKIDRWKRLISAAMKQSGNAREPELFEPVSLLEAVQKFQGLKLHLQPTAEEGMIPFVQSNRKAGEPIILAIGPEGGFSPAEEDLLHRSGFQGVCLSNQILRAETAAISALTLAMHSIDFSLSQRV